MRYQVSTEPCMTPYTTNLQFGFPRETVGVT